MKISKEQISHLAQLARLDITEEEKEKYAKQISDILVYLNQLNEVDLQSAQIAEHITNQENVKRLDEEEKNVSSEELLDAVPHIKDDQVCVKPVFERE